MMCGISNAAAARMRTRAGRREATVPSVARIGVTESGA